MPIFDVSLKRGNIETIEADSYEKLGDGRYLFYKVEGGKKDMVAEYDRNVVISVKKLTKEQEEEYQKKQKEDKDFPLGGSVKY